MNDKARLKFTATLVYDAETMHSGDRDVESRGWFLAEVLGGEHLCLHDNGELGDAIGSVEDLELVPDDDPAAELRAALEDATVAIGGVLGSPGYIISGPARNELHEAITRARAALAATEEREQSEHAE